ncbi:VOC family protein [Cytobacillus sp. IB215665]|uniref:VOC family protein n=1 Tax=Cytobacillus sp. IB215665 TaxID=3097357 RepID=UPI002A10A24D|nr:VOC family protein [Cytobacillus sp. IB215665]MDX8366267.1 VOC family protein [Cytobacillus sp. IB215665]
MKIIELSMKTNNLEEMKKFYTDVLQMILIEENDQMFSVMAGKTRLNFEHDAQLPFYHLCFRTNDLYFQHLYKTLSKKDVLLPDEFGETSLFWEGQQAYFYDPDGNILEVLVRPFNDDEEEPFGWFDVGEIGMPSSSVRQMQEVLTPYVNDKMHGNGDNFAFYGDEFGVFVLVNEGRHWYPTERPATIHPLEITILGERFQHFKHSNLPYTITVKPN